MGQLGFGGASKRQAEDEHKVENPKTLTGTDFNVYMVY